MVRCDPTYTPLLLQLANWEKLKVLLAIQVCQIQVAFCVNTHLPCSSSSCFLCHLAGHKNGLTPYLEACYLFIPCLLANLGLSREYERGDGHTPEVWGPATMLSRVEQTMQTFCLQAEKHLSHVSSASASGWSAALHLICSLSGTYRLLTTDCDGSAQHGIWEEPAGNTFSGSYRAQVHPTLQCTPHCSAPHTAVHPTLQCTPPCIW